ncbi:unnamed protein product [Didymodactylos carnosus]|uniref:Cytochrome P450 n=1 Tax=Didymodactylos carnosus TaxID=1234261 RepID=A0A815EME1_9BILA|nr:unnamed protein product [Didymodactylos carnosus]CAF1365422.1 unnamed protein product [Didymodactylos carnosus]CAF4153337.1 unnamed protein product [Didymodactylos carnosus]CAF4175008.1 unnamed protein product [Didymodactylos carnosus]
MVFLDTLLAKMHEEQLTMEDIQEEVGQDSEDDLERACTMDDLKQLDYLECVIKGQRFAMLEEKVFLSTLLRKFSLMTTQKIQDVCLALKIVMRPVEPIHIVLKRRC